MGIFHFWLDQKIRRDSEFPKIPNLGDWYLGFLRLKNPQKNSKFRSPWFEILLGVPKNHQKIPSKIFKISPIPGMGIRNFRKSWDFYLRALGIFAKSPVFINWEFLGIFYPRDFMGMGIFFSWDGISPPPKKSHLWFRIVNMRGSLNLITKLLKI